MADALASAELLDQWSVERFGVPFAEAVWQRLSASAVLILSVAWHAVFTPLQWFAALIAVFTLGGFRRVCPVKIYEAFGEINRLAPSVSRRDVFLVAIEYVIGTGIAYGLTRGFAYKSRTQKALWCAVFTVTSIAVMALFNCALLMLAPEAPACSNCK